MKQWRFFSPNRTCLYYFLTSIPKCAQIEMSVCMLQSVSCTDLQYWREAAKCVSKYAHHLVPLKACLVTCNLQWNDPIYFMCTYRRVKCVLHFRSLMRTTQYIYAHIYSKVCPFAKDEGAFHWWRTAWVCGGDHVMSYQLDTLVKTSLNTIKYSITDGYCAWQRNK